jgi:hypothetical protein
MVLRCGSREPDVASVSGQLPGLERLDHCVAIKNFASRGIHEMGSTTESATTPRLNQ